MLSLRGGNMTTVDPQTPDTDGPDNEGDEEAEN
jgi:hypothetical protein